MNKLLSASFARLRKNGLFWFGIIGMFAVAAYIRVNQYMSVVNYSSTVTLDNILFGYTLLIGFVMAIFSSIFLGAEYSDGTIRNKLIVGHSRTNIYFSNLITNLAAAFFMCLSFVVAALAVGIPLLGFLSMETGLALQLIFMSIMIIVAYCSIFTMLSMICSNKTTVAVVSILGTLILMMVAIDAMTRLSEPEFYSGISIMDEAGNMDYTSMPNPSFLTGTKREAYQFIFDFIPPGQAMQVSSPDTDISIINPLMMPLYSLFISVVTTLIGVMLFRRKDLK